MPHSEASDLGLHYLPMSFLWDVRHKRTSVRTSVGGGGRVVQRCRVAYVTGASN